MPPSGGFFILKIAIEHMKFKMDI